VKFFVFGLRVSGLWNVFMNYSYKTWRDYFTIDIPDIVNVLTMGL
jgi:hypothetical protein